MILLPHWDIERAFLLDQMRRQDKAISYEATRSEGLNRGSKFNIDTKTLIVWSVAPESKNPRMMDIQETV